MCRDVVLLIKPIAFLPFLFPSPSWLLTLAGILFSLSSSSLESKGLYYSLCIDYSVHYPLIFKLLKYHLLLLWNHAIHIFYRFLAWHCAKPDGEGQNKGNNLSRYPHGPSILYSQLWSWSYGIYCSCHETLLWNWRQNWKVTSILMYYFLIREKSWFVVCWCAFPQWSFSGVLCSCDSLFVLVSHALTKIIACIASPPSPITICCVLINICSSYKSYS